MYVLKLAVLLGSFFIASIHLKAQTGKWKVLKTKNETGNRSECGMAAADGKLYLIGGDGGIAKEVAAFDPVKLTWTKLAEAPIVMHHFEAVGLNDKIYVLEAFSAGGFPNQEPMQNIYAYDIKTNTWQKYIGLSADRRRAGAGAAAYKGKLYLVAGIQHGHSSGTTNMFDVYDPVTGAWTVLPNAPHIRDHCSAAVIKDKLYVVGGRNTSFRDPENKLNFFSQTILDVDCYNFENGTWSVLAARLPLGTGGGAVVNLKDVLYYIGGERATAAEQNAPRKDVFFLDPLTENNWAVSDMLYYGRNGMAAAVLNDKIYIAGGSGGGMGPGRGPNGGPGLQLAMPPLGSNFNFNKGLPNQQDTMHPDFKQGPPPGNNQQNKNDHIKLEIFTLKY